MTKAYISFCKSPYFVWAEAKRRVKKISRRFRRTKRRVVLLKRRFVVSDLQRFTNTTISFLFAMLILNWTISKNHSTIFEKMSLNNNFVSLWHQMWIWIATLRYIQILQTRVWTWCVRTRLRTMPLLMQQVAKSSRANATPTAWLWTSLRYKKAFTS